MFEKPATRSRPQTPNFKKEGTQFLEKCVDSNLRIDARVTGVSLTPVQKASRPKVVYENLGKRQWTSVAQNSPQDCSDRFGMPSSVLFGLKQHLKFGSTIAAAMSPSPQKRTKYFTSGNASPTLCAQTVKISTVLNDVPSQGHN